MGDGVFSRNFWLLVRDYVAAAGVEPLTLGETEPRIWQKILQAMIANGLSVSAGSSRAAMLRVLRDALATGGGVVVTSTIMRDSRIMKDNLRMTDHG